MHKIASNMQKIASDEKAKNFPEEYSILEKKSGIKTEGRSRKEIKWKSNV